MSEEDRYQSARKRVKALQGFYIHFAIYLVVNAGLAIMNFISSPDSLWFYWTTVGWGIGVGIHGVSVLLEYRLFGKEWEERKIKEIMDKERKAG